MERKHCKTDKYGSYSLLEEAKQACASDSKCASVYDRGCDASKKDIFLCPKRIDTLQNVNIPIFYSSSKTSCIYQKGNIDTA